MLSVLGGASYSISFCVTIWLWSAHMAHGCAEKFLGHTQPFAMITLDSVSALSERMNLGSPARRQGLWSMFWGSQSRSPKYQTGESHGPGNLVLCTKLWKMAQIMWKCMKHKGISYVGLCSSSKMPRDIYADMHKSENLKSEALLASAISLKIWFYF